MKYYAVECVVNVGGDACSGIAEYTASSGTIQSPGYDANSYENNADCWWLITASSGQVRMMLSHSFKWRFGFQHAVYKAGKIAEGKDIAIKLNETKFVGIFLAKYGAPRRSVEPCTGWCS